MGSLSDGVLNNINDTQFLQQQFHHQHQQQHQQHHHQHPHPHRSPDEPNYRSELAKIERNLLHKNAVSSIIELETALERVKTEVRNQGQLLGPGELPVNCISTSSSKGKAGG